MDERIEYERPSIHSEDKPVLYRADGTPLKRPIGFNVQTSRTCPIPDNGRKPKGKGKK